MTSLEDKHILKELLQQVLGEIVEYQKKNMKKSAILWRKNFLLRKTNILYCQQL